MYSLLQIHWKSWNRMNPEVLRWLRYRREKVRPGLLTWRLNILTDGLAHGAFDRKQTSTVSSEPRCWRDAAFYTTPINHLVLITIGSGWMRSAIHQAKAYVTGYSHHAKCYYGLLIFGKILKIETDEGKDMFSLLYGFWRQDSKTEPNQSTVICWSINFIHLMVCQEF